MCKNENLLFIPDGEETQNIAGELFKYDFDQDDMPNLDEFVKILRSLWSGNIFVEGIIEKLKEMGYEDDELQNPKNVVKILKALCNEAGVKISSLADWIEKGKRPEHNLNGRKNIYRLCFALKMDAEETKTFFLKKYLDRPFNSKDIEEAVYLFCLRNGKTYSDAMDILEKIQDEGKDDEEIYNDLTNHIGDAILSIKTDDEFIKYIINNRNSFKQTRNKTGRDKVSQLLDDCMDIAKVTSIDELLDLIYFGDYYDDSVHYNSRVPIKQKDKDENNNDILYYYEFPKYITTNFPERQQFENILKNKNPSYDSIRKALIILDFFQFFYSAKSDELEKGQVDEFEAEINSLLYECGYVQFYKRNPFDLMIYYCALSPSPIDRLRDFIYNIIEPEPNK